MSNNLEEERPIFRVIPDNLFMAFLREGVHPPQAGKISEAEIAIFCGDCDHLRPSNTCELFDLNTQAIQAEGKQCNLTIRLNHNQKITSNSVENTD